MDSGYQIPYFWAYVGPQDMPEPGFYEDPTNLHPYGLKLEKMWRSVGLNWNGDPALVFERKLLGEVKSVSVLLQLDIFHEGRGIKPNGELALLIRGYVDEQNMNGHDEHIQQLYIPRAKCIKVTRISPDEWQEYDTDPLDAILTFCADFQSVRYMDSEAEADVR